VLRLGGGAPLRVEDFVVGAIGVSGVHSDQDGITAQAGERVLQTYLAA
jgi:uncharacterized protein GlcG (DUF336 family)